MTCVTCQMFVNTKQMKWLKKHSVFNTHSKKTNKIQQQSSEENHNKHFAYNEVCEITYTHTLM